MNRKRVKSFGAIGISVLGVLALASCSSSSKSASTTSTSAAAPTTTESVTVPSTRTTTAPTTAATTPVEPVAPAVSASFVSPNRGWVLEQDGAVAETTDGGASWRAVGSVGTGHWESARIRFIGDSDGFAFGTGTSPLMITHDGGATWMDLDTPFAGVYDLSVLRGMIYVVGMPTKATGSFGIWSTPTGHLVWKRDPLSLEIGAGPVPTAQIVLSGDGGWIVIVNRTVISGAHLSGTSWSAWNPPCLDKNGPFYLAASTSNDLVASCDEGVWGGTREITPSINFSHNAGKSFDRSVAPAFGPVLSPSPSTAIVAGGGGLQRTVDDGSSWRDVLPFDATGGIPDGGFTTSTQGFILLGHEMLMTHDAGASWQPVTLP